MLALLASGIALDQFILLPARSHLLLCMSLRLVAMATVLCDVAYLRWRANQFAMRHMRPLPANAAIAFMAWALLAVSAAIGVVVLLR